MKRTLSSRARSPSLVVALLVLIWMWIPSGRHGRSQEEEASRRKSCYLNPGRCGGRLIILLFACLLVYLYLSHISTCPDIYPVSRINNLVGSGWVGHNRCDPIRTQIINFRLQNIYAFSNRLKPHSVTEKTNSLHIGFYVGLLLFLDLSPMLIMAYLAAQRSKSETCCLRQ